MSHLPVSSLQLRVSSHHQGPRPPRTTTQSPNMKPPTRLASQAIPRLFVCSQSSYLAARPIASRALHSSSADPANVAPFCATGPPPEPPQPAAEHPYAKVERRRKQAELLKNAKEIRDASSGKNSGKSPLKKRFWQDVHVKEVDGAQIHLASPKPSFVFRRHELLTSLLLLQAPTKSTSTHGPCATQRPRPSSTYRSRNRTWRTPSRWSGTS